MTPQEQYLADEHEMKTAMQALHQADIERAKSSDETRKGLAEYYDKLLLYSAGAFSFQITLLQFVPDKHLLAKIGSFGQPNIFIMYGSLFFYLLTAGLILLSKKLDTHYVNANASENYREKLLKDKQAKIAFFTKYPSQIIVQDGVENQLEAYRTDITKIEQIIDKDRRGSAFYFKLTGILNTVVEFTVIVATILLFVFAVELSQTLVW